MATKDHCLNQIVPGGFYFRRNICEPFKGLQIQKKKIHIISDQKQQKPNWIPPENELQIMF